MPLTVSHSGRGSPLLMKNARPAIDCASLVRESLLAPRPRESVPAHLLGHDVHDRAGLPRLSHAASAAFPARAVGPSFYGGFQSKPKPPFRASSPARFNGLPKRGVLTRTGERRHTRYQPSIALRPTLRTLIDDHGEIVAIGSER